MFNKHAWGEERCVFCGTVLGRGEDCDCMSLPIVHQRATCPYFSHRASHRGQAFIVCRSADGKTRIKRPFDSEKARDAAYERSCCEGHACITRGREYEYARELRRKEIRENNRKGKSVHVDAFGEGSTKV